MSEVQWSYEDPSDATCGRPCTPSGCHDSHPTGTYVVNGPEWDDDNEGRLVNEAHARLFAAAPELLEAAKGYLAGHPCSDTRADMCPTHIALRAAIAKAEGDV